MILNSPYISGSSTITGNLNVLGSISGSTNSAISASYALNATSASYALNSTATLSSSYAATSSYADTFTVAGTLTAQKLVVQTITSSIVYSSGSNVFGNSVSNTQSMTGSVGISGSLAVVGAGTFSNSVSIINNATTETKFAFSNQNNASGAIGVKAAVANNANVIYTSDLGGHIFETGTTERMCITPSGSVGIGTTSPITKLHVSDTGGNCEIRNTGGTSSFKVITGTGFSSIGTITSDPLVLVTNDTERMRITSGNNVGIGVIPSAWTSGFTALQVKNASFWSTGNDASITANAYYNGSNYIYIASSGASRTYHNTDGSISWYTAPSGTAGNAITFTERLSIAQTGAATFSSTVTSKGLVVVGVSGGYTTSDNPYINLAGAATADTFGAINHPFGDKMRFNAYHGFSFRTSNGGASGTPVEIASISTTGAATFSALATGAVYSTSGTLTNTAPSITATGGTIVTSGGFKYHTFTSSGTFQVTAGSGIVEVFVLGGGGAGGGDFSGLTFYAGGGGAGGGLYNPAYYVEVASYTVTIGAGGAINPLGNAFGGDGGSSVFGNITALGGGGGSRGNVDSSSSYLGRDGGCGGGGGSSNSVAGITIQSITNGVAYGNGGANGSGAAGGGGGIGTQPTANTFGGFGKYVMNQANRIGGGGGGGTFADGGVNAYDGGGRGGRNGSAGGTAGTANTGGGGGGLGYITGNGGAGGSGIVIVKYKA
jgi:hypothetical protein